MPFESLRRSAPAHREMTYDLLLGLSQTMGLGPMAVEAREGVTVEAAIRAVYSELVAATARRRGVARAA